MTHKYGIILIVLLSMLQLQFTVVTGIVIEEILEKNIRPPEFEKCMFESVKATKVCIKIRRIGRKICKIVFDVQKKCS